MPSSDYRYHVSESVKYAGFHDDTEHNTFGKMMKNCYCPASDFRFELKAKVVCNESENTGFIITVYPKRVEDEQVTQM